MREKRPKEVVEDKNRGKAADGDEEDRETSRAPWSSLVWHGEFMLVVPTAVLTSPPTYLPTDLRNLRRGQARDGATLKISPIRSTSAFIVTATCHPCLFFFASSRQLAIGTAKKDLHIYIASFVRDK